MKKMFKLRFDKRYNPQTLVECNLTLVSREGNNCVVSGTFWDALQLKNYPFVKDLSEVN